MNLGDIMKAYRAEHRLTQQELADRAGVSKGYISMLERGTDYRTGEPITPTIETVMKLAGAMQISASDLLRMMDGESMVTVNAFRNIGDSFEAVASYSGITVDELKSAIEFIKTIKR